VLESVLDVCIDDTPNCKGGIAKGWLVAESSKLPSPIGALAADSAPPRATYATTFRASLSQSRSIATFASSLLLLRRPLLDTAAQNGPLRLPTLPRPPNRLPPTRDQKAHLPTTLVRHRLPDPPHSPARPAATSTRQNPQQQEATEPTLPARMPTIPRRQTPRRLLRRPPMGASPTARRARERRQGRTALGLEPDTAAWEENGWRKVRLLPTLTTTQLPTTASSTHYVHRPFTEC